jgi:hypothetical protein
MHLKNSLLQILLIRKIKIDLMPHLELALNIQGSPLLKLGEL